MHPWPIVFITSWLDVRFFPIHIKKELKFFLGFSRKMKIIFLKGKGYTTFAIIFCHLNFKLYHLKPILKFYCLSSKVIVYIQSS